VREILERYPPDRSSLLDILHDFQDADPENHLSTAVLRAAAQYVGVSLSEVLSTATFYSMFSLVPRGHHIIRVCESPPCQLMGGTNILSALSSLLGVKPGETTNDGAFTLETTSCLGVCGVAPAMMIDDELYGNLTSDRLQSIIARVRRDDATG